MQAQVGFILSSERQLREAQSRQSRPIQHSFASKPPSLVLVFREFGELPRRANVSLLAALRDPGSRDKYPFPGRRRGLIEGIKVRFDPWNFRDSRVF